MSEQVDNKSVEETKPKKSNVLKNIALIGLSVGVTGAVISTASKQGTKTHTIGSLVFLGGVLSVVIPIVIMASKEVFKSKPK